MDTQWIHIITVTSNILIVGLGDTEIVVTAKDIVYNGEWMSLIILYVP